MTVFTSLEDSPMFRKQVSDLEEDCGALRERCLNLEKGSKDYSDAIGEMLEGETSFANALEDFGGDLDDPISGACGGPVMTKFTIALREVATFRDVFRHQMDVMMCDRMNSLTNNDLQDVKDVRKRFDKATLEYDTVLERFL
eukprot:gene15061-17801_t